MLAKCLEASWKHLPSEDELPRNAQYHLHLLALPDIMAQRFHLRLKRCKSKQGSLEVRSQKPRMCTLMDPANACSHCTQIARGQGPVCLCFKVRKFLESVVLLPRHVAGTNAACCLAKDF
eukprot:1582039-Amphidinium_carterae.1